MAGAEKGVGSGHSVITLSELIAERQKDVGDGPDDLGLPTFRNERTDLTQFMAHLGVKAADSVTALTDGFEAKLQAYLSGLKSRGSVGSKRTRLVAWRALAANMMAAAAFKQTFQGLITSAFESRKLVDPDLTITGLAREAGMDGKCLKQWMSGRRVAKQGPSSYKRLGGLEEALRLPSGTLVSKVQGRPGKARYVAKRSEDPAGHVTAFLTRVQVRSEWPDSCKSFFDRLVAFKGMGFVQNAAGEQIIDAPSPLRGWGEDSADVADQFFGMMFAWLTLPVSAADARRLIEDSGMDLTLYGGAEFLNLVIPMFQGRGMAPDEIRPYHLFQPDLVSQYLAWRTLRAGGVNHSHTQFLRCVIPLLQPKFGFVVQQPELGWEMPSSRLRPLEFDDEASLDAYDRQKKAWAATCERWLDALNSMFGRYTAARQTTGTRGKLRAITDSDDPLAVLEDLIDNHATVMPFGMPEHLHGGKRDAVWLRDHVLLLLMISNPLRNRNVREMTWNCEGANLYQPAAGTWKLRYEKHEFKNDKGARKAPYDVDIPPRLIPYLELYLFKGRPLLVKEGVPNKNRVFITERGTSFRKASSLSELFVQLTGGFLTAIEGIDGFRSHAWRYIVATGYLKATGDFMSAALILHDEVDTVLKSYAFLRPNDGFDKYERWLSSRKSRRP